MISPLVAWIGLGVAALMGLWVLYDYRKHHPASNRAVLDSVDDAEWRGLQRTRNVTDAVRAQAVDGRLNFRALNQVLTPGEDMEPRQGKVLFVTYTVNGRQLTKPFPENTDVVLP